jgi:uncharacterized membrane protein
MGADQEHVNAKVSRLLPGMFFVIAGILHFVFTPDYMKIMPPWLPWHRGLVLVSGACEIAGGLGVLWHLTRRWAGYGLIALCLAVLPANVQMLLDAQVAGASAIWLALLWLRLPLQFLLIGWIWRATHRRVVETDVDVALGHRESPSRFSR